MGQGKRLWAAILLLTVLMTGILPVKADTQEYRQQMLRSYSTDPDGSSAIVERCLRNLESESPAQGAMWRQIMSDWDRLNHSGFAYSRSLSDDLAQDDSLCIVVFGYGLNKNGSMKPELYDRLNVALQAARQYPNAYIAVTGGETSNVGGISEAAVMAIWLMNNDIPEKPDHSGKTVSQHHGKRQERLRPSEPEVSPGKTAGGGDQRLPYCPCGHHSANGLYLQRIHAGRTGDDRCGGGFLYGLHAGKQQPFHASLEHQRSYRNEMDEC